MNKCLQWVLLSLPVIHTSSWATRGPDGLSLLCLPHVLSFLVFPSMFVFVNVCLDQIAHLHWVDLPTLAVAHLTTKNTSYLHIHSQELLLLLLGLNLLVSWQKLWTHLLDSFAYNLFVFIFVDVSPLVERLDGELHLFYSSLLHVQLLQILTAGVKHHRRHDIVVHK